MLKRSNFDLLAAPDFVLAQFTEDGDLSIAPLSNIQASKIERGGECMVK